MKTDPVIRIGALGCMLLSMSGCGLKGDLYIPEREATGQTTPEPAATTQPAPSAGDDQAEDEKTVD